MNVAPQYTGPGATNLIIGNWSNTSNGLMSFGVHQDYSWIQSFNSRPLHINRMGNNVYFGNESGDNVGIGQNLETLSAKLHVVGTVYATGTITSSDRRLKKNIGEIDIKDMKYKDLKPVSYNFDIQNMGFKSEGIDTAKVSKIDKEFYTRKHYGFIAQDVQQVFPEFVYEDNEGKLAIDYSEFIPLLFKMVQEQEAKIEELNNEIVTIKNDCCSTISNLKSASISTGTDENLSTEKNALFQNSPNPFTVTTAIRFSLSKNTNIAMINIYNMNGMQLKSIGIHQRGDGSITVNGGEFTAGMYLYSLIADGQVIDTKRMVLTD